MDRDTTRLTLEAHLETGVAQIQSPGCLKRIACFMLDPEIPGLRHGSNVANSTGSACFNRVPQFKFGRIQWFDH